MEHIINGIYIGDIDDAMDEWERPTVDGIICCMAECVCSTTAQREVFDFRFLDGTTPPLERLPLLLRWYKNRDRVLVHCRAGISRSAAVAAWLIARAHAYSMDDALALVRAARPIVIPHSRIWRALRGHGKVKGIDKYKREIAELRRIVDHYREAGCYKHAPEPGMGGVK